MAEGRHNDLVFIWDNSSEDLKITYCDPCKYENKTVDSEGYCINCEEYLCHSCLQSHRRFKAFRTHILLCGDSMPKEKTDGEKHTALLYCDEHQTNEVKYYCFNHKVVYCRICQTTKHSTCNNRNISEVCNIESDKIKLKSAMSNIETVKESFDRKKKSDETRIGEICKSKKTYKEDLKLLHGKMRLILGKLEEEINKQDLDTDSVMNELQERIAVSTDVLNHISSVCIDVNQAMASNDPPTIFAALIKLLNVTTEYKDIESNFGQGSSLLMPSDPSTIIKQVNQLYEGAVKCLENLKYAERTVISIENQNKSKSTSPGQKSQHEKQMEDSGNISSKGEQHKQHTVETDKDVKHSFRDNATLKNKDKLMVSNIEKNMMKDDSIVRKLAPQNIQETTSNKQHKPMGVLVETCKMENLKVLSRKTKTIQTKNTEVTCDITGCLFLTNGKLVLCDHANSNIILFDNELNICDELKLNGNVWDVAQVKWNEVVVSLVRARKLAFVTMVNGKFDHVARMDLRRAPWGVASDGKNIIISFHNNPGNGVIEVRQRGGQILKQISVLEDTELLTPFYIALDQSNSLLYISESKQNCIICMTLDGQYIGQIKNDDLKWPRKVIVGENKSVAVCSSFSNSIIFCRDQIGRVSEGHWLGKPMFTIPRPQAATIRWNDITMVVTTGKSNSINVLKFST